MKNEILKEIEARLGEGFTVEEHEQPKNNGIVLHGIIVKKEGSNVSPQFYIDGMDEDKVADFVVAQYKELEEKGAIPDPDGIKSMLTKENILKIVFPSLINRKKNKERFEKGDYIHRPYLDMEIIYKMALGGGFVTISQKLLEMAELTEEELYEAAIENAQGKARIMNIFEAVFHKEMPEDLPEDGPLMLIVTNTDRACGAGMILDKEAIRALHEKLGDFYAIPSSIHEMIAVPSNAGPLDGLKKLVKEQNRELGKDEVLSDSIYVYRQNTDLEIA